MRNNKRRRLRRNWKALNKWGRTSSLWRKRSNGQTIGRRECQIWRIKASWSSWKTALSILSQIKWNNQSYRRPEERKINNSRKCRPCKAKISWMILKLTLRMHWSEVFVILDTWCIKKWWPSAEFIKRLIFSISMAFDFVFIHFTGILFDFCLLLYRIPGTPPIENNSISYSVL